jgi:16S rRNA (adenine1518-N6/adenine1519-N6)-dimethyltransferase
MTAVRPKKQLGQHFLTDNNIARKIVDSLSLGCGNVIEVGPGMGVLTKILLQNELLHLKAYEVDIESVDYLKANYPQSAECFIYRDFLRENLKLAFGGEKFAVIGNFPYNISSQIFFKVLEIRDLVPEVVGMVQKEVAERIAAPPGSKTYGILSVLLQAYYTIEYLFTVHEHVFNPPPKVKSAVIRLVRNEVPSLPCNEKLFTQVVKSGFNQRRKMLRNSLKNLYVDTSFSHFLLEKRPEQLSVADFVEITNAIETFLSRENL